MASKRKISRNSKRVKSTSAQSGIRLMLLLPAIYKVKGNVSGKWYVFNGSGSVLLVNEEDVPFLMEKRTKSNCCGGGEKKLFELVSEV